MLNFIILTILLKTNIQLLANIDIAYLMCADIDSFYGLCALRYFACGWVFSGT